MDRDRTELTVRADRAGDRQASDVAHLLGLELRSGDLRTLPILRVLTADGHRELRGAVGSDVADLDVAREHDRRCGVLGRAAELFVRRLLAREVEREIDVLLGTLRRGELQHGLLAGAWLDERERRLRRGDREIDPLRSRRRWRRR